MTSNWNGTQQSIGFMHSVYTFVIFVFSCASLLFMGVFYLWINFVRESWLNYLEKRFPNLEFVRKTTLRSAIDTHRNMGIITLLLTVKGHCSPSTIKKRLLEDIVEKKQNDGQYVYRHLRMPLTTRWGWYAWQKFVPFKIDNHLIFANSHYRGRPLSDANIQDCVSETVSKYFVPDLSPWQITIFQLGTAEKYYLLLRFHHMLLSPQGMDLESFLTISKTENEGATEIFVKEEDTLFRNYRTPRRRHPFQELYKTPKALPKLFERVHESFTNNWNEFLSAYDPAQNPSVTKRPSLKTPVAILIIVFVSVIKQMIIHPTRSLKIFTSALSQREMSWSLIVRSVWNTLNPLAFVIILCKSLCNFAVLLIKSPLFFACEFRSLYMINDDKYIDASYVKAIISLWIAVKNSLKEIFYYMKLLYNGPRVILEEFLLANKYSNHHFQFVSLCGRKVVSWSNPVPLKKIQEIEDVTGASESEILIAATSSSLRDFLMQYSLDVPDTVLTMARYFPEEQLIQSRIKRSSCGSGVLCLPLPIRNPFGLEGDPVIELRAVQQIILRARLKQPALYLASLSELEYGILTKVLPSPILRLIFNLLSRRFSVILSEVAPSEMCGFKKHYLWGQEVEDLMYWKPPQANICVSLTLMTFGDHVRLGVIADALLSPHHTFITGTFAQHIWELAAAADVTTNSDNYSFVSDESGSSGPTSRSSRDSKLSSSSSDLDFDGRNYFENENNLNQNDFSRKYFQSKQLKFNIPYEN